MKDLYLSISQIAFHGPNLVQLLDMCRGYSRIETIHFESGSFTCIIMYKQWSRPPLTVCNKGVNIAKGCASVLKEEISHNSIGGYISRLNTIYDG